MADLSDKLTGSLLRKSSGKNFRVVKIPQPQKTWFVKQVNGRIFACSEAEAWSLVENANNQWTLRGNRFIGVSSGETYVKGLIEASKITIETLVKDKAKLKKLTEAKRTEMVNQAVKERMQKAFDDELAIAIENNAKYGIERPRKMNVVDLQGNLQTDKRIIDSGFIQ